VTQALVAGVLEIAKEAQCSGIHWLFATKDECQRLCALGFAERASYQFHWHNRGYESFEDFLATLTSRKRKQIRKERRRALAEIDELEFVAGGDLTKGDLAAMDRLYRNNVWAHGGMDYLHKGFFHRLAEYSPDRLLFARARRGARTVAGGIYLETEHGLYGRYWGCSEQIEFLHFEVAYYAGIERCIERGTPLFEAGAQGEHKLVRGFEPSRTYSCHFLCLPQLDEAIRGFLREEAPEVENRMAGLSEYGPYKRTE
jgi:predicted N-acyltransferase